MLTYFFSQDDSEEDGSSSPSKRRRTSEEIIDGEVPSNDLSPEVEIAALRRQVKVCRSRIHTRKSIRQPAKVDDAPVKFERLRQEFLELRAKYQELDAQRLSEVETNYRLMRACDEALDRLGAARRGNRTLSRENKNLLAALEGKSNALDQRGVQMEELRSKIRELQEGERGAPPDGGVVGSVSV